MINESKPTTSVVNKTKPNVGVPQTELNIGSGFNLLVGGVYKLIIGAANLTAGLTNSSKVSIGETWATVSTTWATEIRTWLGVSQLITNIGTAALPAAPDRILDLTASGATTTTMDLTWTEPYSPQPLTSFTMKYSTVPIGTKNWDSVLHTTVTGLPTPVVEGKIHTVTVTGLTTGTYYYFSIKSTNDVPLTSPVSNLETESTL